MQYGLFLTTLGFFRPFSRVFSQPPMKQRLIVEKNAEIRAKYAKTEETAHTAFYDRQI